MSVVALILAGGQAKRMGGLEKAWQTLHGRPLLRYTIDLLQPQVNRIVINANRDLPHYQSLGFPVISDAAGTQGPLAGIAAALDTLPATHDLLVVPCDMPFLPVDLCRRLRDACYAAKTLLALAHDGQRLQPLVAYLRPEIKSVIIEYILSGQRRVDRCWLAQNPALVEFNNPDAFVNINTLEELARSEREHE